MIASQPAVQFNARYAKRCGVSFHHEKRLANRRHRRHLNAVTRGFISDPEAFYAEGFDAPSVSDYDLD